LLKIRDKKGAIMAILKDDDSSPEMIKEECKHDIPEGEECSECAKDKKEKK